MNTQMLSRIAWVSGPSWARADEGVIAMHDQDAPATGPGGSGGAIHESTQGHPPTTVVLPKGNR